MSLINCKIDLNFKWTKYCVLSTNGNNNVNKNDNANNITLSIKSKKIMLPL